MTSWLLTTPDSALTQTSSLGGKARSLAEAEKAGLPVPRWIVLLPEWIESRISPQDFALLSEAEKRHQISSPELVESLKSEISETLKSIFIETPWLAVRSSAQDEDGREHSFAGMLESFLFVPHDQVADKIIEVWLSGWSDRLSTYLQEQELTPNHRFPAVIIQAMVDAEKSGVAFGIDPVSGHSELRVVSAVWGLGSGLVSGECDSDTAYVNPQNELVQYTVAEKITAHRQGKSSVISIPVEEARQKQPVLSPAEVMRIAELVRLAGQYFGSPQDIEWAFSGGKLYLLQSRPITTPVNTALSKNAQWHQWDNTATVESWPETNSPLTYAVARKLLMSMYRDTAVLTGFPKVPAAELQPILESLPGYLNGRIYLDHARLDALWFQAPAITYRMAEFLTSWQHLKTRINQTLSGKPGGPIFNADIQHVLSLGKTSLDGFLRLTWLYLKLPRMQKHFHQQLRPYLRAFPADMSVQVCCQEINCLLNLIEHHWQAPNLNTYFLQRLMDMLHYLDPKDRWLSGEASNKKQLSYQFQEQLRQLARLIQDSPVLKQQLASGNFSSFDTVPAFQQKLAELMKRFGDRCALDLKMESTPWREHPAPLIQTLLAMAEKPAQTSHIVAKSDKPMGLCYRVIRHHYRQRLHDREVMRLACTQAFAALRRRFLWLGEHYFQQGFLDVPREILLLDLPEITALINEQTEKAALKLLLAERAAEQQRFLDLPALPDQFTSWGPLLPLNVEAPPTFEQNSLQGQGCSPGVVHGEIIRLSENLNMAAYQGKILVAPYGDPGLVRFYPVIAGLLLERGSALSHAAIVARELCIPTVTGLRGLTGWVHDGEMITLDGATGHIRKADC